MFTWYRKLFAKGPADAEKSLLGCLVANFLAAVVVGAIGWLLGAHWVFHQAK